MVSDQQCNLVEVYKFFVKLLRFNTDVAVRSGGTNDLRCVSRDPRTEHIFVWPIDSYSKSGCLCM